MMPFIALAIVASLLLGNVKITKMEKRSETGHLDTGDAVEKRPFVWALIKVRSAVRLNFGKQGTTDER